MTDQNGNCNQNKDETNLAQTCGYNLGSLEVGIQFQLGIVCQQTQASDEDALRLARIPEVPIRDGGSEQNKACFVPIHKSFFFPFVPAFAKFSFTLNNTIFFIKS